MIKTQFNPVKLQLVDGVYRFEPVSFIPNVVINIENIDRSFLFAKNMAFGNGFHRANRSGGTEIRSPIEIFRSAFEGKLGEFAVKRFLELLGFQASEVDLSIMPEGEYDNGDLSFSDKLGHSYNVSVKTTEHYSSLMLLEKKDYDQDGNYLHSTIKTDYIFLCRIAFDDPNGKHFGAKKIIPYSKSNPIINTNTANDIITSNCFSEYASKFGNSLKLSAEVSGFLRKEDLAFLISENFVLWKDSRMMSTSKRTTNNLEKRPTILDATNYYVHIRDLRKIALKYGWIND